MKLIIHVRGGYTFICSPKLLRIRLARVVTEQTRVIWRKHKYLYVYPDNFGEIAFLKKPKNCVLKSNHKATLTQFLTFMHRFFLLSKFLK